MPLLRRNPSQFSALPHRMAAHLLSAAILTIAAASPCPAQIKVVSQKTTGTKDKVQTRLIFTTPRTHPSRPLQQTLTYPARVYSVVTDASSRRQNTVALAAVNFFSREGIGGSVWSHPVLIVATPKNGISIVRDFEEQFWRLYAKKRGIVYRKSDMTSTIIIESIQGDKVNLSLRCVAIPLNATTVQQVFAGCKWMVEEEPPLAHGQVRKRHGQDFPLRTDEPRWLG